MGRAAKRKREAARAPRAAELDDASSLSLPDPRWLRALGPVCAATGLVGFLVLKCYALHPHRVDEGIYFYDALRLTEGARLYRDIFFAHPPLHLLPPALLVRLFGYSFLALKALPQLFGAAQGLLAYLIGRRVFSSEAAGVLALLALLYTEDFLKASSYFTGINLADALLFLSLLLLLHRRPRLGGAMAAAATMTLLQTAPVAAAIAAFAWLHDRRLGARFGLSLVAGVVLVNLGGALYAGSAFFDQVYLYHLRKTVSEGAGAQQLGFVIADNVGLFVGGAASLALLLGGLERRPLVRRFLVAVLGAVALQVVAMATRPRVFPFYFQPVFLPLALALGGAAALGISRVRAARSTGERLPGLSLCAGVLLLPTLCSTPVTDVVSPTRASQLRTYTQSYTWKDAPLVGGLNGVVRALFFADGRREAGTFHLGITEYLWNQSRAFDAYPEIVDEVKRFAPEGTLFGDSASTPLVALGAGWRIAADFADTNEQRFSSGATPADQAIAELEQQGGPTLLLASGNAGLFGLPAFKRYLTERYTSLRSFADGNGTAYTLYRRR